MRFLLFTDGSAIATQAKAGRKATGNRAQQTATGNGPGQDATAHGQDGLHESDLQARGPVVCPWRWAGGGARLVRGGDRKCRGR